MEDDPELPIGSLEAAVWPREDVLKRLFFFFFCKPREDEHCRGGLPTPSDNMPS